MWVHIARRKHREGWPVRKIAKYLDRSVEQVEHVLYGR
jgi:hypothetical protein